MTQPDEQYLITAVEEALTQDPRVAELGIEVTLAGDTVVLSGTVATEERRQAVAEVARELIDGRPLRNEVSVADLSEAQTMEQL